VTAVTAFLLWVVSFLPSPCFSSAGVRSWVIYWKANVADTGDCHRVWSFKRSAWVWERLRTTPWMADWWWRCSMLGALNMLAVLASLTIGKRVDLHKSSIVLVVWKCGRTPCYEKVDSASWQCQRKIINECIVVFFWRGRLCHGYRTASRWHPKALFILRILVSDSRMKDTDETRRQSSPFRLWFRYAIL
jgi:hypothetical protein